MLNFHIEFNSVKTTNQPTHQISFLTTEEDREKRKCRGGENKFYFPISLSLPYLFLVDFLG
jgi:hypothetical protein